MMGCAGWSFPFCAHHEALLGWPFELVDAGRYVNAHR